MRQLPDSTKQTSWRCVVCITLIGVLATSGDARAARLVADVPQYRAVQDRLARGWNTWNTRSVLAHVLLPEGFGINLALKEVQWLEAAYLRETLIGDSAEGAPTVEPGPHAYDGRYTRLELQWRGARLRIESAHVGEDLVVLVSPLELPELAPKLVVETAMYWNRPGLLSRLDERRLQAQTPTSRLVVHATVDHEEDYYVGVDTPYLVLPLEQPLGLSTGAPRSLAEIRREIEARRAELEAEAARYGTLAEAYLAVQAGIAWNLIYEPREARVVATVGRLWNRNYGGYCLFGWDNFFLAYMTSLVSRDLAYANVIEHLRGATDEGFIPNDNRGNGSKSFDRSQPPVGSLMVREIAKRFPERWFLEAVFEPLLRWNRWWLEKRRNEGLLSYGSHEAPNPFLEPSTRSKRTAGYESGMDDSPMYEGVPFNREKNTLELVDVGLTSLWIADAEALTEIASLLGREADARRLEADTAAMRAGLEGLWSEEVGLYLNRRSDTGEVSTRLSPTLFYPLLAGAPGPDRARRMIDEHLLNTDEFWGDWVLPSIARSDPAFPKQRYWKGAIWPPLNYLTYYGLRRAGFRDVASRLSEKSLSMFLHEWRAKGYVSENYSSLTGTGDDERLSSDPFHSWGALFGIMAFVDAGALPAPEAPLRLDE